MPWRERGPGKARMGSLMLSLGPSIFPSLLGCGTQFETYRLWHRVPKKVSLIYIPFLNYDNALLQKGSNYCWLIEGRFWRRDSNWNKFVNSSPNNLQRLFNGCVCGNHPNYLPNDQFIGSFMSKMFQDSDASSY